MTEPTASLAKIETQIAPRTESLEAKVAALTIRSHQDAETMATYRGLAKGIIELIHSEIDPPIAKAHEAHRSLTALRTKWLKSPEALVARCDAELVRWDEEQERLREERERQQNAEEKERQEAAAAEVAAQLEREGRQEEAEAVLQEAIEAPAAIPPPPPSPKVAGWAPRKSWGYRLKNPALVPRAYCCPDDKLIKPLVTRLGPQAIDLLGGPAAIEVFKKTTPAGRR